MSARQVVLSDNALACYDKVCVAQNAVMNSALMRMDVTSAPQANVDAAMAEHGQLQQARQDAFFLLLGALDVCVEKAREGQPS